MAKTIEIDEMELQQLRSMKTALEAINRHPKGGLLLEEAHKAANPEAKTPKLDLHKEQYAPVEDMRKEVTELKKQLAEEKAENEKNSKLAALQSKVDSGHSKLLEQGWTQEGLKVLDEFREKEGILDPIAAAAYYEKLNGPQATPAMPSSGIGAWDFTQIPEKGEEYAAKLLRSRGDNDSLVMGEAKKVIQEFRGNNRR
jgi:hypothetical protein